MSSVRLVPPKDNHLFFKNQNRRLPAHLCASVLSAAFLGHLHFRLAVSAPQEPIYRHSDDMFNISEKQRFFQATVFLSLSRRNAEEAADLFRVCSILLLAPFFCTLLLFPFPPCALFSP